MNDMTDQPAWATDPRGLPPVVVNLAGVLFGSNDDGTYGEFYLTPSRLEDRCGPCTPLWPDTPPTSIDPADIRIGMRVRRVLRHKDGDRMTTTEGIVTAVHPRLITLSECVYYLAEGGGWFLIEDAPDPDEQLVEEVIASTEQEARELIAMLREQGEARR